MPACSLQKGAGTSVSPHAAWARRVAWIPEVGTVYLMTTEPNRSKLKPGYNVWFGLQHVTLTGFRHSGRREDCPRCNPALAQPAAAEERPNEIDPAEDAPR